MMNYKAFISYKILFIIIVIFFLKFNLYKIELNIIRDIELILIERWYDSEEIVLNLEYMRF